LSKVSKKESIKKGSLWVIKKIISAPTALYTLFRTAK